MIAGVRQVMPGCLLRVAFDRRELDERRYWAPRPSNGREAMPDRHAATPEALHERLEGAVTSHLAADVPVGALLSGGVDSSLVVAHMMKSAGSSVHTFSVGFDDDRLDERAAAACVARHLGTTHHEQLVTAHDAAAALPAVVASMDQPLADYAAVPTYLIARFAAQHVKVVLTGEGADELFGGYRRYRRDWLLSPVQAWRAPYQPSHVFSARETAAITGRPSTRVPRAPAGDRFAREADGAPQSASAGRTPRAGVMDRVNQLLVRDVEGWLSDDLLVKVDRMTMACSLEARVPYLDHRFVEYALSIPGRHKIGMLNGATKMILRQAALPLVPAEIASRRKHGFKPPIDGWLRGPLRTLARDALLSGDARLRQRVDAASVHRLFDALDDGRPAGHRLWTLLVHELWSRDHGVA
jgi:asparagine synthase (glutamine-hydrolysing)